MKLVRNDDESFFINIVNFLCMSNTITIIFYMWKAIRLSLTNNLRENFNRLIKKIYLYHCLVTENTK